MITYLDASVLVPRFVEETSSESVSRWITSLEATALVSAFAVGEFASAIARLTRIGTINADTGRLLLDTMDEWCANITVIDTDAADVRLATKFVRRFDLGLRLPDAIHLAACRRLGLRLATFDVRMMRAAQALGIDALAPA